ncbi:TerD family protein [Nocardia sp. NPDC004151]|uniref:TerD family protein n=2 Tax=unclassified Nocardia TaxID=2637762 RepID=UPI0036A571D9
MSFGFRVGVPGMSVRVSTRGVRTSVGPRIARVSMGAGRTRVSSGFGPFFASTSLSGGRRGSTGQRRSSRPRAALPSPAQLERARRQAERAQQEAERAALIEQLQRLRLQMTSVHLQHFEPARPPVIPNPPLPEPARVLAAARAFHLSGIGMLARSDRAAAKQRADEDARRYSMEEQQRLEAVHQQLITDAAVWWQHIVSNDEGTVCEAVNLAFSDNPAAGCAVGVDGSVLSVVMRQPDIDSLPDQAPGFTPSGRLMLKALTKRDRALWWLTAMGSNVIGTLLEGFAVAPGITAIDLAVLSRLPDTQRLGFVAYGRWSRDAVARVQWRYPNDALRFLDIGEDVACSITTSASGRTARTIKALDIDNLPGLRSLLDHAQDDSGPDDVMLGGIDGDLLDNQSRSVGSSTDPYAFRSFAEWRNQPVQPPRGASDNLNDCAPILLAPGQMVSLPEPASDRLQITCAFGGADADLTLLLGDPSAHVASDVDFIFYGQPSSVDGSVQLLGKQSEGPHVVERAELRLAALPPRVQRIAIAVNMDVDAGLSWAALSYAHIQVDCAVGAWSFTPRAAPDIRAIVVAELFRHVVNGVSLWGLRAIGYGWAEGLPALARAHGVTVS